jgi:hypothetical protein
MTSAHLCVKFFFNLHINSFQFFSLEEVKLSTLNFKIVFLLLGHFTIEVNLITRFCCGLVDNLGNLILDLIIDEALLTLNVLVSINLSLMLFNLNLQFISTFEKLFTLLINLLNSLLQVLTLSSLQKLQQVGFLATLIILKSLFGRLETAAHLFKNCFLVSC